MKGIPTVYAGVQFRSRLEATWAAFFDQVGWRWTYEPYDLPGWIPDFVLHLANPVLVEVKPEIAIETLEPHVAKIDTASRSDEVLLVGIDLLPECWMGHGTLGLLREDGEWGPAFLMRCFGCKRLSFGHSVMSYRCRACGKSDGDGHIRGDDGAFRNAFSTAKNLVQWRKP